jgi:hypothetical protein
MCAQSAQQLLPNAAAAYVVTEVTRPTEQSQVCGELLSWCSVSCGMVYHICTVVGYTIGAECAGMQQWAGMHLAGMHRSVCFCNPLTTLITAGQGRDCRNNESNSKVANTNLVFLEEPLLYRSRRLMTVTGNIRSKCNTLDLAKSPENNTSRKHCSALLTEILATLTAKSS